MIRRAGPSAARRSAEHGFTLVELMIALMIFGMLAAAGVALLSVSIRSQAATIERLDEVGALNRLTSALAADLAQASLRATRDENGVPVPPFRGSSGGEGAPFLQFVRGGWSNLDDAPRPGEQKVAYRLDGESLQRISYPMLDGARPLPPATLLGHVASVALRYRIAGSWTDRWDGAPGTPLPQTVELIIGRADGTTIRAAFLVGTGYRKPASAPGGAG